MLGNRTLRRRLAIGGLLLGPAACGGAVVGLGSAPDDGGCADSACDEQSNAEGGTATGADALDGAETGPLPMDSASDGSGMDATLLEGSTPADSSASDADSTTDSHGEDGGYAADAREEAADGAAEAPVEAGPSADAAADSGTSACVADSGATGLLCGGACADVSSDPSNCGGCGLLCPTGCTGGVCIVTLASGQAPSSIALNDTSVFWFNNDPATLVSVSKDGGPVDVLESNVSVAGVAADNANVYWVTTITDAGGFTSSAVAMRAPVGGGAPTTLAQTGQFAAGAALGRAGYYFVAGEDQTAIRESILMAPFDGGTLTTFAQFQSVGGLAVNATHLCWVDGAEASLPGTVMAVSLDGGSPYQVAVSPASSPSLAIAVDATSVYWAGSSVAGQTPDLVLKAPISGGTAVVLATGQASVAAISVDSTGVYWVTYGTSSNQYRDGTVMRTGLDGGTPAVLAAGEYEPDAIAVDGTSVYWLDYAFDEGIGTVRKLTPK